MGKEFCKKKICPRCRYRFPPASPQAPSHLQKNNVADTKFENKFHSFGLKDFCQINSLTTLRVFWKQQLKCILWENAWLGTMPWSGGEMRSRWKTINSGRAGHFLLPWIKIFSNVGTETGALCSGSTFLAFSFFSSLLRVNFLRLGTRFWHQFPYALLL